MEIEFKSLPKCLEAEDLKVDAIDVSPTSQDFVSRPSLSGFFKGWLLDAQRKNPEDFASDMFVPYIALFPKHAEHQHCLSIRPGDRLPRGKSRKSILIKNVYPVSVHHHESDSTLESVDGNLEVTVNFEYGRSSHTMPNLQNLRK